MDRIAPSKQAEPPADGLDRLSSRIEAKAQLPDGSGVAIDLGSSEVLFLNKTAMTLLDAFQAGTRSPSDLASVLEREFSIDRATALRDAEDFLRLLAAGGQDRQL